MSSPQGAGRGLSLQSPQDQALSDNPSRSPTPTPRASPSPHWAGQLPLASVTQPSPYQTSHLPQFDSTVNRKLAGVGQAWGRRGPVNRLPQTWGFLCVLGVSHTSLNLTNASVVAADWVCVRIRMV